VVMFRFLASLQNTAILSLAIQKSLWLPPTGCPKMSLSDEAAETSRFALGHCTLIFGDVVMFRISSRKRVLL